MTWADQIARAAKGDVSVEWPEGDDEWHAEAYAGAASDDRADEHLAWRPPSPEPTEPTRLGRVFDAGAQRFEDLVTACQAELEDAVSEHVSTIGQTIAEGTEELNRAADMRVAELEREVDARLADLEDAAVNDRFVELASRTAAFSRLAIAALIVSIVALGIALAAFAAASS